MITQEVTGRFAESVKEKVFENESPTFPEADWPACMIGVPAAMENVTLVISLVPPSPVAVRLAENEPIAVGVPVIAPVLALSDAQAGRPVAAHEVTGRFVLSVSENVLLKASPTLPEPV